MKLIRLDRFIAETAGLTRSQARQAVKNGQVKVNEQPIKKGDQKVDPEKDRISLKGQILRYEPYIYIMLHKPRGVVSATTDPRDRTVVDGVETFGHAVFPVGRLDKDTEGLLLLTDDGQLAHNLLAPGKHVDKTYYALLDREVGEKEISLFKEGLDIGDARKTLPACLKAAGQTEDGFAVRITIREGRFHQIKRMFHAVGAEVLFLKRERMGSLTLDEALRPGQYRQLTEEELSKLQQYNKRRVLHENCQ